METMVIITGSKFFQTKHLELTDTVRIPLPPIVVKAPASLPLQWQHICAAVETKTKKKDEEKNY